ncbi:heat shock protein [Pseudanabaena phage Pan1]|nr:heat shock protein [Pseudanabaena phage Pan1]
MSDLDELAAAGEETNVVDLKAITALAHKMLELEADVARKTEDLKKATEALRKVQEGDLPAAMKAAGMTTFGLDNGMTVGYEEDLKISVPKARKAAVIEKMKEWGYAANVSNTVTIDLGKGNDNAVKALKATAEEMGVEVVVEEDIPSGTVKKALRKRAEEGKSDDLAFFGAFSFTKATVK